MREYTLLAVLSVLATVAVEVLWLRTGVFRTGQYWISMGIVYFFHVLVDGWLTKLSAPIVIYDSGEIIGLRVPWDIPVEDYLFGFSMITLTLLAWLRVGDRDERAESTEGAASAVGAPRTRSTDRSTEETA